LIRFHAPLLAMAGLLLGILLTATAQDDQARSPTQLVTTAPPRAGTGLIPLGTTYSRAQAAAWLDAKRFVVGRWDGTVTVFRTRDRETEFGPVLIEALATPSRRGVEMVARLGNERFVTSNDTQSIAFWRSGNTGVTSHLVPYSPSFGMAVSAIHVERIDTSGLLIVGHEQGYVTFWSWDEVEPHDSPGSRNRVPKLIRAVSVRSDSPVSWQWQTWHVRGLAKVDPNRLVTVSEDGDICLLDISSGTILSRRRYHAAAARGLNDVAVVGDLVAVVNCAVGEDDRNLWVYQIEEDRLNLVDSRKLILDKTRDPVFTFSVELLKIADRPHFIVSTEEGLIWLGIVKDNKIEILDHKTVAAEGGVVLALSPENETILAAGHQIQTFTMGPRPVQHETTRP